MTTFDDREKSFEKKFAHDEGLKFKAEARRNNLIAAWAAEKLGIPADGLVDYQKEVRRADLAEKGDEDVVRKLKADFAAKGLTVADDEIRAQLLTLMEQAIADIEAKG
ncbi:MAG: DUF1476 domain-containing protein [Hyphomicrobiaceae bacterium]|nr:DUF1476 domain-containing protein [Hyphomicrobiaceae bacterium]